MTPVISERIIVNCPEHGTPLERLTITQGDKLLGYIFICPHNEWGSLHSDTCSYCLDGDDNGDPIIEEYKQIELFTLDKKHHAGLEITQWGSR